MKKNVKRLISLLLVCMFAVTMVSCKNSDPKDSDASASPPESVPTASKTPDSATPTTTALPTDAPPPEQSDRVLNVAVANDPGTLHPLSQTGDGGFSDITHVLYDAPIDILQDGTMELILLESYDEISETEYTLHLRKNAVFNNGNPFTAEDFMFSAELSRDNPQYSVNVKTWDFEKTKIVDNYTINLILTSYDVGMFPAMSWLYMFDKESYNEQDLALTPNGTGPYKLEEYLINSHVIIEANPNYWGTQPAIKTVKCHVINEESQRVNAITTGTIDFGRIPTKDVPYVESLDNYSVVASSPAQTTVAYFNVSPDGPLGSVEARKAVMHAIDRQSIIDVAYDGQSSFPSWPNSEDCVDFEPRFADALDVYKTGYDPVLAKQYAEQSGLTGKTLRIINNGSEFYSTLAVIIQNDLEAIGVKSDIITYDQATFVGVLMDPTVTDYDIGLFIMSAPSRYAIEQMTSWPGFISMGWKGEEHDLYLETGMKGMAISDTAARQEILQQLLDIFGNVYPWFPLSEQISFRATSNDLASAPLYADGTRYRAWEWK